MEIKEKQFTPKLGSVIPPHAVGHHKDAGQVKVSFIFLVFKKIL